MTIPKSLCVLLFGDLAARARRLGALEHFQVVELSDGESVQATLARGTGDVLVVCGGQVPESILTVVRRPPIIWISEALRPGIADVLLASDASEAELRECVELLGRRFQVVDELERLSASVQDAAGRYGWRGQSRWHGPHELLVMALTDPLTNLYSRRHFDSSLRQEFDRALSCNQPLSLILIDLDQFKPVNDTWGHGVGDAVLIAVAGRIRHATRSTDIVCRYGGDEFAVIAPGTAISSGKRIADRLRAAISSESYAREDRKIHIGCSVGVASLWPDALTPAELLLRADEALITAKRAGGNRICCSD